MPNPRLKVYQDKLTDSVRKERPAYGYITDYLVWMRSENAEGAEALEDMMADLLSSENGIRFLILLEKSVLHHTVPLDASDGALRELNAVRHLVTEIRRYATNGR